MGADRLFILILAAAASAATLPSAAALPIYPVELGLEPLTQAIRAEGLVAPQPAEGTPALVHLDMAPEARAPLVILRAARAAWSVERATDLPDVPPAPLARPEEPAPGLPADAVREIPAHDNVTVTLLSFLAAPQSQLRMVDGASAPAAFRIHAAECALAGAHGDPPTFPRDANSLVSIGPGALPHPTLDARCAVEPVGGSGTVHLARLYGMELELRADGREPEMIRTGTFQEPILHEGVPLHRTVSQVLRVVAADGSPLHVDLPAASHVDVRAPAFDVAGRIVTPAGPGLGRWGDRTSSNPVPSLAADGLFLVEAGPAEQVRVTGSSTGVPDWPAPASVRPPIPAIPLAAATAATVLVLAGLAWSLFARLTRADVAGHPRRRAILDLVGRDPGATIGEAARVASCDWPSARYHVWRLERDGLLHVRRQGGRWALYAGGARARTEGGWLRRPALRAAFDLLQREAGLDQAGVADRLGVSQQAASKTLRRLTEAGLVVADSSRRPVRYRAASPPSPA